MKFSEAGINLLEDLEGKELTVYQDSSDKATIGIGHLIKAGEHFTELTEEEVYDLLRKDLQYVEKKLNQWIKPPITQNQYDAMVCLAFNIGAQKFLSSSVLRFFNLGHIEDAAEAFLMWNKHTKMGRLVFSQGLMNRRKKEMKLFLAED